MCPQLACNVVLLVAVNMAGVFTHHPSELAKRQAFLETRQCIEARLTTQRENQQQVRAPRPAAGPLPASNNRARADRLVGRS